MIIGTKIVYIQRGALIFSLPRGKINLDFVWKIMLEFTHFWHAMLCLLYIMIWILVCVILNSNKCENNILFQLFISYLFVVISIHICSSRCCTFYFLFIQKSLLCHENLSNLCTLTLCRSDTIWVSMDVTYYSSYLYPCY